MAPDQDPHAVIIDARGLMCPEPIALASKQANSLESGTDILVLATDLAAPIDFEAWCIAQGHQYRAVLRREEHLEISISLGK